MITPFLTDIQAWYEQPAGIWLLEQERQALARFWPGFQGDSLLQMGLTTRMTDLAQDCRARRRIILTPNKVAHTDMVAHFAELPVAGESVDLVLAHHWPGLFDTSVEALQEIYRVLAPGGKLIICAVTPAGYWKYYDEFHHQTHFPHSLHSAHATLAKKWVIEAGFSFEKIIHHSYGFSLQLHNHFIATHLAALCKPLQYFSRLGVRGGGYILIAEKKVSTLTPIKVQWKKARTLPEADAAPVNNVTP